MSPIFAGLSLIALSALAWRRGWVTKWRARKPYVRPTQSEDFWIGWSPKPNGTPSPAVPIMANFVVVDYCDRHPSARATYVAFKDDLDLTLCDHCTHTLVEGLTLSGFDLHLIPGIRATVVTPGV